ncbi:MAG: hypothetical protein ABJE95_10500 [Byssovorax sp.]
MNPPRDHFARGGLVAISPETKPDIDHRVLARLIAAHNELMCPGYAAATGITDAVLDAPSMTLAESVEAGEFTPAEGRQIAGTATAEDLAELGYSPEEVSEILAEQALDCASST